MGRCSFGNEGKVTAMGLYPKFADTINAFLLTASAVSAHCLAKNYSLTAYLTKVKNAENI